MQLKVKIHKKGQLRQIKLTTAQYRQLGETILAENKKRIARGINADGLPAKPLSKRYSKIKAKRRGIARPIRDLKFTGLTLNSYQVQRAWGGLIRIEPQTPEARRRAFFAQRIDPMIGFTPREEAAVNKQVRAMVGRSAQAAWTEK